MTKFESLEITEKQFESQVKDLAKMFGWLYYHTWRSFHSPAGFPDCVMVRDTRTIFAELKTDNLSVSQPSFEQYAWLYALNEAGQEVYLWRPGDLDTEIVEVLR